MRIDFNSSPGPSVGVEVELEIIDPETGELASAATEILKELGAGHPDGEHPKAKHELFECTIEIITGVCQTAAEIKADLNATLAEVRAACDRRGLALMCSGSHPFSDWRNQDVSPSPRYAKLIEEMRWMAERLQIFGVHVHVGVRSPEKSIAIANAVAGYIPHLLALTASSPYWEGHDTGLASSRSKVFEGLPTAGLPAPIESWEGFERFMETLVESSSISSIREVWWDIRPHPNFGTIELRMCDGIPTLGEVASIAALAQALVANLDQLDDRGFTLPRYREWILRQNKWRAGRYGLDTDLIMDERGRLEPMRTGIAELVDELTPIARKLDGIDELCGIRDIVANGPSYVRQRRAATTGADGKLNLRPVVDQLVTEMATDTPTPA
jgi:carboxylate-amine ligase